MFPEYPYPEISVIICSFNEEKNIGYVLPKIPKWVDEILLIDGHSTDETVAVAERLLPNINVIFQPNKGKGDALKCGFKHASKDIIVTLDADGATDPLEMNKFVKALLNGYDFAKGSRFLERLPAKKPLHRMFGNLLIAACFNALYLTRYSDLCSGYNAFWRKQLGLINMNSSDCYEDEPLLISKAKKAGLRMTEIGHVDFGRIEGESKSPGWRQGFKAMKTITRERIHR
jgi:glycosyltransferase involved in cell wall biosynthesis